MPSLLQSFSLLIFLSYLASPFFRRNKPIPLIYHAATATAAPAPSPAPAASASPKGKVLLTNAKIYTVSPSLPWAEALLIDEHGDIESIGPSVSEILQSLHRANRYDDDEDVTLTTVDMGGRLVLPGIHDVHLHVVEAGLHETYFCLIDPRIDDVRDLPAYLESNCTDGGRIGGGNEEEEGDGGRWIVGVGFDVASLLDDYYDYSRNVTANDAFDAPFEHPIDVLDRAHPATPVLILDDLGHAALANSKAMSLVGYSSLGPAQNPPGGILLRDVRSGALTGVVLENAQQPLRNAAFPPTASNEDAAYRGLLHSLEALKRNGITTVSDAGGFWRQAQTESWTRAEREGTLTVRARNAWYVYPDEADAMEAQLRELIRRLERDDGKNDDALVKFTQAKLYVDGIFSLLTSALHEPYLGSLDLPPEDRLGFEYFGDRDALLRVSRTLADAGYSLHFHVTGDRAATLALDAIEATLPSFSPSLPHRLTHCYLVRDDDLPRFAALGAYADFQLSSSGLSPEYAAYLSDVVLGDERTSRLFPASDVRREGGTVVLSSDWDADDLSPWKKIQTVLMRGERDFRGVEDVLPSMTRHSARLLGLENKTGSLEVGKAADLVVLSENIFEVGVEEIGGVKVLVTMLQGRVVFDEGGIMDEGVVEECCGGSDDSKVVMDNISRAAFGGLDHRLCMTFVSLIGTMLGFVTL